MGENFAADLAKNLEIAKKELKQSRELRDEIVFDEKMFTLIYEVFRSNDLGQVVIVTKGDPYSTLKSTFDHYKIDFHVSANLLGYYQMKINNVDFARGYFTDMETAKTALADLSLIRLQDICFTLVPRSVVVTKACVIKKFQRGPLDLPAGLSMGAVPGRETNVLVGGVTNILIEFEHRGNLTSLSFQRFTDEDMQEIVQIARRFNVEVEVDDSTILVSKKINRMLVVKRLLRFGAKEKGYSLRIPQHFHYLWFNCQPLL